MNDPIQWEKEDYEPKHKSDSDQIAKAAAVFVFLMAAICIVALVGKLVLVLFW